MHDGYFAHPMYVVKLVAVKRVTEEEEEEEEKEEEEERLRVMSAMKRLTPCQLVDC